MSTITRERLHKIKQWRETYGPGSNVVLPAEEAEELARIALASLEAEAVCVIDQSNLDYLKSGSDADVWPASRTEMGDVLLYRSSPPSPVSVPDELSREEYKQRFMEEDNFDDTFRGGWNACRVAMLQGAESVTTAYKFREGWVDCSERMPSPSTGVLVAAPWQSAPGGYAMKWATNCPGHPDADTDGWIIPGASWSPTHWMPLPAAPQEVKP